MYSARRLRYDEDFCGGLFPVPRQMMLRVYTDDIAWSPVGIVVPYK